MEINSLPSNQSNPVVGAGTAAVNFKSQESNSQQVTPARENAEPALDIKRYLKGDRLVKKALEKNVIKDQRDIGAHIRATIFDNHQVLFTNIRTGEITRSTVGDIVGDTGLIDGIA